MTAGGSGIVPLRPPEVERAGDRWRSRWSIRFRQEPVPGAVRRVQHHLPHEVTLTHLHGLTYRLEFVSAEPPMFVESYLTVDEVLLALDERVAPIEEINDSPRDAWRTFRNRRRRQSR